MITPQALNKASQSLPKKEVYRFGYYNPYSSWVTAIAPKIRENNRTWQGK